ncbi:hypothetical protein FEM48_Zijuj05G0175700 [Ziziphus jujuba var. spinosa]|uniref:Uncharacterized protein n=1 Tax=Ziziphus jujuba var. spinosa TaxID=714518 RepID=A0A978VG68_ZIZJJ|nr:hypothetical protein FEM48_Zijuj05G0175700 [Ziziphus jujuba var. spinosa]
MQKPNCSLKPENKCITFCMAHFLASTSSDAYVGYNRRSYCNNLRTVSKYFRKLDFQGCSRLKIPNVVEKIEFLTSLDLCGTAIKVLHSLIDLIVAFQKLYLSMCKELVHVPSSIYKLKFLGFLDLKWREKHNYDREVPISSCGVHLLWDQHENMVAQNLNEKSPILFHKVCSEPVSARTNIFGSED